MKAIILIAIFTPLVVYSLQISKFVKHINVEVLSASTLLLGYLHGPIVATVFCFLAGFYGSFKISFIRFLMIVRIVITAIIGLILTFFRDNLDFSTYFIVGILVMNVVAFFVYLVIDPDPIQNYTHRISHLLWNLSVVRLVYIAIFNIFIIFIIWKIYRRC